MHRAGPRAAAPFVDVNCAALPDNLLEAELFGYERGAFTGANQAKPGLFQLAHQGMLFLDEIGMLPPALQAKLLKVLEDGAVRRLGGTRAEPVDVWVVAATNEDLAVAMRERRFREDLYHRLAVLTLELPPLRDRAADIMLLAERFLARACADYGLPPKTFARDARAALGAYGWPGNVRELGNVIERVALLADESVITAAMLGLPLTPHEQRPPASAPSPASTPSPAMTGDDRTREHLLEALTQTGWNISQTAVRLGVARNTVLARMKRFELNRSTTARSSDGDDAPREPLATPRPAGAARATPAWESRRIALLHADVGASRHLDELITKVETFGGDVVELGPSAVVAAFGMEALEDAPVRAALAAMAILKASERVRSDAAGPHVTIVLHVAHVLVSRSDGTWTIDLESKRAVRTGMEALVDGAPADTIVVSEAASPFLERRFELTPTPSSEAGGAPLLRLARREQTGFGLGGRPLSRFVGRDNELQLVSDRVAAAVRGQGQVIGIVGEPGVGKSRFVYELTQIGAMHDWRVLRCGGVSHGTTTPLLPVAELLRRYFAIEDADATESIHAKVSETLLSRHEALSVLLTPLLSLLDVAVEDPAWSNFEPSQQRRRIQDAVKELLRNESRIQPLLVIVEDLHWIDPATQALLDGLIEILPTARLLLVVDYRPEYEHRWGSKTYYSQLRLGALPPENTGELLRALVGDDPGLEPLTKQLVRRGNPFFIEESIRTLVETGALSGTRGAYQLSRPIEAIEIPATVHLILAERIERLASADKQLLQTASVIGKDVPFALLDAVTDDGEEDLQRELARLSAAEFLYETRLPPDLEYTFKHALTHDVTYGTLLEDRRMDLHRRIVGAIERVHPDRLTEHVERLAYHAVQGEMWEKAVTYLRQAGLRALVRSSTNRDAALRFEQALTALAHLPESRETLELAIDLRVDLKASILVFGEFDRIVQHLREAERLAVTLNDTRRLCQVSVHMCQTLSLAGNPTEALAFGRKAHALVGSLADVALEVAANLYLGAACLWTAQFLEAEGRLLKVLEILVGDLGRQRFAHTGFPAVTARSYLTQVYANLGRFEEGIACAEEGIQLAEAVDHPYFVLGVSLYLGQLLLARGEYRRALGVLERVARLVPQRTMFAFAYAGELGYAYAVSARLDEGIALLENNVRELEALGHTVGQSSSVVYLGEAYVLADRFDDALMTARRALALGRDHGHRNAEAKALLLLGKIAARRDAPEEAAGYYRDALALAEELGMRPVVAHCHAGLGKLFESTGKGEESRRHLTTATTMYREMGMTFD
jgi:transcriptional regulator with AAA-type ATPase domain/tetratricopeptide (TPR) repeat protein